MFSCIFSWSIAAQFRETMLKCYYKGTLEKAPNYEMAHYGCNILWVDPQVYSRARLPADNIRESYMSFF